MLAHWEQVLPEFKPSAGSPSHPSVRYSACAVQYRGHLIVSHGYFYNHLTHQPAWQSDAWSFNFNTKKWRLVHRGEHYGAPSSRYSATAVEADGGMYMFGGDDGGHKYSLHNYVFKAWFDELWRLDLRSFDWRRVEPVDGKKPPKRALHTAVVVGGDMYVYAGLDKSDTWRYSFRAARWTLIDTGPSSADAPHPGKRHAHSAAAAGDGFFIFGGTRHGRGLKPTVFNDLWWFSIHEHRWSLVPPVAASPKARSHHSLLALQLQQPVLLLYGGALCTPGCTCYGDAWAFDSHTSTWRELNATNPPIHRYRQNLVLEPTDGAVYLFGGESYRPYMYHNAVDRLLLPWLRPQGPAASASRRRSKEEGESSIRGRIAMGAPGVGPPGWQRLPSAWEFASACLGATLVIAATLLVAVPLVRRRWRIHRGGEQYECLARGES